MKSRTTFIYIANNIKENFKKINADINYLLSEGYNFTVISAIKNRNSLKKKISNQNVVMLNTDVRNVGVLCLTENFEKIEGDNFSIYDVNFDYEVIIKNLKKNNFNESDFAKSDSEILLIKSKNEKSFSKFWIFKKSTLLKVNLYEYTIFLSLYLSLFAKKSIVFETEDFLINNLMTHKKITVQNLRELRNSIAKIIKTHGKGSVDFYVNDLFNDVELHNLSKNKKMGNVYLKIVREIDSLLKNTDFNREANFISSDKESEVPSVTMVTDINQWKYAVTNIWMIVSQSNNREYLNFNLVLVDLYKSKGEIETKIKELKINEYVKFYYVDSEKYVINESKLDHVTSATNIRIFLPEIIDDYSTYYVDNDVVHKGDIVNILKVFDREKAYGRRWSPDVEWIDTLKKMTPNYPNQFAYFNAGVMHLPLQIMRESDFIERSIKFYLKNNNKIKYADQDILNSMLKIEDAPYNINICRSEWPEFYKDDFDISDYSAYHFLSRIKQWDKFNIEDYKVGRGSLKIGEIISLQKERNFWVKFHNEIWANSNNDLLETNLSNDKVLILITLYKYIEEEVDYWMSISQEIRSYSSVAFAYDGKMPIELKEKLKDSNIIYSETNKNIGKISSIFNFVKLNKDTLPKFIKIIDPDDEINVNEYRAFCNVIANNEIYKNIITPYIEVDGPFESKVFHTSLATYNTTLLSSTLLENELDVPLISKSSDCILGFLGNVNRGYLEIDFPFYHYQKNMGISNPHKMSVSQMRKYLRELDEFLDFFIKYEDLNINYEYNSSPSHSELKFISKILPHIYDENKSEIELINYFYKFKKVTRGNEARKRKEKWDRNFLKSIL